MRSVIAILFSCFLMLCECSSLTNVAADHSLSGGRRPLEVVVRTSAAPWKGGCPASAVKQMYAALGYGTAQSISSARGNGPTTATELVEGRGEQNEVPLHAPMPREMTHRSIYFLPR